MDAISTYHITVRGCIDQDDLNLMSPLAITVVRADVTATEFIIRADQSGLIGLLRHLHGRGVAFLSVTCE
jgi:hypothetical protein